MHNNTLTLIYATLIFQPMKQKKIKTKFSVKIIRIFFITCTMYMYKLLKKPVVPISLIVGQGKKDDEFLAIKREKRPYNKSICLLFCYDIEYSTIFSYLHQNFICNWATMVFGFITHRLLCRVGISA